MKEFNQNYETIKLLLFKDIKEEKVDVVIETIKTSLLLSEKKIQAVLTALEEDKDIIIVDDILYVLDNIHFAYGKLRVIRGKFGFVGEGDDAAYIGAEDFKDALDQDEVLVRVKHGQRTYGLIEHVIKRTKEYILGTIKLDKKRFVFEAYDRRIPNKIEFKVNNIKPVVDQRVIAKIIDVVDGVIKVEFESVLGMVDEPGIDILSVLFEHNLETEFNNKVNEEALLIPEEIDTSNIEGRIDHRSQNAITIDGEDAKDLDDAIYIETLNGGYRLYVHIADVSHYVKEKSAIDKTAFVRTSSIYMVDRVIPMLPKEISNGICSLHPNVDRFTLTCQMDIDFKGNIYNYELYPSIINSKRRMSYNEVNNNEDFGDDTEMIELMLSCADALHSKRNKAGSIDFESSESQFLVDAYGRILDITMRETGKAEKMIEAFMVSANESVAKYAVHQELPILYRVHEKPDLDKMKDLSHTLLILGYRLKGNLADVHPNQLQNVLEFFKDKPEHLVVSRLMLRSMKKARYATDALGHFGLALEDYAHFTAPIRRYSDLLTHRNLRKYIFDHNFSDYEADHVFAKEAADHVSETERNIKDAEREVEKMKKSEYMYNKIGESYEGVISGVNNFGIFVELANTVEGVVPLKTLRDDFYTLDAKTHKLVGERTKQVYALGQKVEVKVESINELENDVIMSLKKTRKKGNHRGFKRRKK
ncbi:MAG: ribonuclease R [Erysipelothrix sp.]|nr:ribonuclease R [Erysipelothrix sp.]